MRAGLFCCTHFTPGTYTGEASGRNGILKVEVAVDARSILSVTVSASSEPAALSDAPIIQIPQAIVDGQTLAVAAVSGATLASRAILATVTAALEQAGRDGATLSMPSDMQKCLTQ